MRIPADYCYAGHSWLFDEKLLLRAVRTAFHINTNGVRDLLKNGLSDANSPAVDREIEKAVKDEPTYTHRLIASRFHQTLAMIQRKGCIA